MHYSLQKTCSFTLILELEEILWLRAYIQNWMSDSEEDQLSREMRKNLFDLLDSAIARCEED